MKTYKIILISAMTVIFNVGCVGESGGGSSAPAPALVAPISSDPVVVAPAPTPTPSVNTTPTPVTTNFTYYKISKVIVPMSGYPNKNVTVIGSCGTYLTKTYCWDNGTQTVPSFVYNNNTYGPFSYNFWALSINGSTYSICDGGCTSDYMATSKFMTQNLILNTNNYAQETMAHVFSNGVQVNVTCTESNGQLNCGTFTITLQ